SSGQCLLRKRRTRAVALVFPLVAPDSFASRSSASRRAIRPVRATNSARPRARVSRRAIHLVPRTKRAPRAANAWGRHRPHHLLPPPRPLPRRREPQSRPPLLLRHHLRLLPARKLRSAHRPLVDQPRALRLLQALRLLLRLRSA